MKGESRNGTGKDSPNEAQVEGESKNDTGKKPPNEAQMEGETKNGTGKDSPNETQMEGVSKNGTGKIDSFKSLETIPRYRPSAGNPKPARTRQSSR